MYSTAEWLTNWVFQPSLLPAWLSALAASVALGISVWAGLRAGAVERRRDRLQASGIVVAIYPELLKLKIVIQTTRDSLLGLKANVHHLVGQSVAANLLEVGHIELPPMLDRNIDRLFLLGKSAGPFCLQLVNVLYQYDHLLRDIGSSVVIMNAQQWPEAIHHLDQHLDLIDAVVDKCESELRSAHENL